MSKTPKVTPAQDLAAFAAFVDGLGLRYFKGKELAAYATRVRNGVKNSLPPLSLWPNIVRTLCWADLLRHTTGKPLTVTSAYRSPRYNRAVGGEPASFHMSFYALDLTCDGLTGHELAKRARSLRGLAITLPGNAGTWRICGGVGAYDTFVHIDSGTVENRDW